MADRVHEVTPKLRSSYLRAAAAALPGGSLLPGVPGGGGALPQGTELQRGVHVDRRHLRNFRRLFQLPTARELPLIYPHLLAFPLHMALMTDPEFPFPAIGTVHLENTITRWRPVRNDATLELRVRADGPRPHRVGLTFDLVTEVYEADTLLWEERSTMLRRGARLPQLTGGDSGAAEAGAASPGTAADAADVASEKPAAATAEKPAKGSAQLAERWRLPATSGRRYAGISGDRNPIHLHPLSAQAFGFPRAIAHGMELVGRVAASLDAVTPVEATLSAAFRKPVLLPSSVAFVATGGGSDWSYTVQSPGKAGDAPRIHLTGALAPARSLSTPITESR